MPKKAVKKKIAKKVVKKAQKVAITHVSESSPKYSSKSYLIVYQSIIGVMSGAILSLLLAWFYSGAPQFATAPFSMIFAYSMFFGIPIAGKIFLGTYPIGILLGVYFFGRKMNLKGNFIMALAGFVLYTIIFELTKYNINTPGIFWTYSILLPLFLIMLTYYFFVIIERKTL